MKRSIAVALLAAGSAAACTITTAPPPATPAPATPAPAAPAASAASAPAAPPTATPAPAARSAAETVAAVIAAWSAHDANRLAALYAGNAVRERLGANGWNAANGREAVRADVAGFLAAFPDLSLGASRVLEKDKQLVVQWVVSGTNRGSFAGKPATNKKMGINGASLLWLSPDGLIERERVYADDAMILAQLGEAPKGVIARPVAAVPSVAAEWVRTGATPGETQNVAIVRSYYNGVEKNVGALIASLLADNVVQSSYALPGDVSGKQNVIKTQAEFRKLIDHVSVKVEPAIAAGPFVALENATTASLAKPGSKVGTVHGLDIMKIEGGKIVHIDDYSSNLESGHALGGQ